MGIAFFPSLLTLCLLDSSILFHVVAVVCSVPLLFSIPLCDYATIYLAFYYYSVQFGPLTSTVAWLRTSLCIYFGEHIYCLVIFYRVLGKTVEK